MVFYIISLVLELWSFHVFLLKGPPIRGPCGASYRPSENFAISSGHQPFLVEILIDPKAEATTSSAKCLGTIISPRHVLSVGIKT